MGNELMGRRFKRLLVISYTHTNKHGSKCYLCRCDCGTEKIINGVELRNGKTIKR